MLGLIVFGAIAFTQDYEPAPATSGRTAQPAPVATVSSNARLVAWTDSQELVVINFVIGCDGGDRSANCRPGIGHTQGMAFCVVNLLQRLYPDYQDFNTLAPEKKLDDYIAAMLTCDAVR